MNKVCVKNGPCGNDLDSWINVMIFTHLFASVAGLFLGALVLKYKLLYDAGLNFPILSMIVVCGSHLLLTHWLMYGLYKKETTILLVWIAYSGFAAGFFMFTGIYIGLYFQYYKAFGLECFTIFIFTVMTAFMLYTAVTIHSQRILFIQENTMDENMNVDVKNENMYVNHIKV